MTLAGFPHSEIFGSTPACDSPKLFAANHVLHRLLMPRHSPSALSSLTTNFVWLATRIRARRSSPSDEWFHESSWMVRLVRSLSLEPPPLSIAILPSTDFSRDRSSSNELRSRSN